MPFTLAHAAAVVPLRKACGKRVSLSALVIGSMMPDLVYFIPLGVPSDATHSIAGLFWFCLPAGLMVHIVFHWALKRPMIALLPPAVSMRLPCDAFDARPFRASAFASALWIVAASVTIGAATHLAWDAFTHRDTAVVEYFAFLRVRFAFDAAGRFSLPVYRILQHLSSAVGLLLLAWWILRWMQATPPARGAHGRSLPGRLRLRVIAGIASVGLMCGLARGAAAFSAPTESMLFRAVTAAGSGMLLILLLYCLAWHAHRLMRRTDRKRPRSR